MIGVTNYVFITQKQKRDFNIDNVWASQVAQW